MAEFAVEYDFDADGICVTELIAKKDFLALSLGIPKHSLQVLSWGRGSVITYRVLRDMLPLAELAMYRENTQRDLIQHGVKNVYFAEHLSQQPNLVSCREGWPKASVCDVCIPLHSFLHCRWTNHHRLCTVRRPGALLLCICVIPVHTCVASWWCSACWSCVSALVIFIYVVLIVCILTYICSAETCHCDCPR